MKRIVTVVLGLAVLAFLPGSAVAQTGTIEGTVTEQETDDPLPGATVQLPGLNTGTATDQNGAFELTGVPTGTHTVRVSFVGYQTAEREVRVRAGQTTTANFELQRRAAELGEVVVTGYRRERQAPETGSASSVSGADIETVTAQSPDAAIQGRAAGVRVTSASGQPGAAVQFRVRGSTSITSGSDPLYIVDGVQVNAEDNLALASGNPLTSINPSDIASIEVLKDAAAASIYGAQAANGVVIITTKSGRAGDTQINFSAQLGSVERTKVFDVMNTEQYFGYQTESVQNTLGVPRETAQSIANQLYGPDSLNTNWQDLVFQTGLTQSYDLSIRGGDQDTRFFISGQFQRSEGQVLDSQFRQGGIRTNFEQDITDDMTVEAKINLSTGLYKGTISGGAFINSPFWSAQFIPPTAPLYTEPGNPNSGFNLRPNFVFSFNPVALEEFNTRESQVTNIISNVAFNYAITPSLSSRTFAGISHENVAEDNFEDPRLPSNADVGGVDQRDLRRTTSYNVSQTFSYNNVFADKHAVSGLVGGEMKQEDVMDFFFEGQGFPTFQFRQLASAATPTNVNSFETGFRQLSTFGNVEYTYDNRYRISGTVRYDGSSRFGSEQRWGLFGTVSGQWRLSNEAFMEDYTWLDDLALRASYGVTGNSQIGNFSALQLLGSGGSYDGGSAIRPTGLGNQSLTWEENWETNIGVDYSLFGGRLSGAVDVYRRDRQEQLLNRDIPFDSGFTQFTDNVGRVRSEGLELSISTINLDRGDFTWRTNFNISFQRTEVEELLPEDNEILVDGQVFRVGEPFGQIELPRYAGVNPANGRPLYFDADGELTYQLQEADNKLVGNEEPSHFGGFGNTFSYKGLTLDVFFQFDYGRETLNNNAFFSDIGYWGFNKHTDMLDYWEKPGDVAEEPRPYGAQLLGVTSWPDGTDMGVFSTRFLEDASYIRLKQVKLSYQLPQSVVQRSGLRRASLFVQGENLMTWTNFTGPDPELIGTALGEFPQSQRITGGIRVGL